jgi:dTDP-4-dehydrorhamnose reductase
MAELIHILVTGGAGQVGLELARAAWPPGAVLHRPTRQEMDMQDERSVTAMFGAIPFRAVINAAAYTAVDRAESEAANAFAANALGPAILADLTRKAGIPLIQVSTDYVFDGRADTPYAEEDAVAPLGVYGASKLAGELAVRCGNPRSVVLRTAWVLSAHRSNFLKTMLRLAGERSSIKVVGDQWGCPTSAGDIATTLVHIALRLIEDPRAPTGIYHFVNAGETTWAGLAGEIFRASREMDGVYAQVEEIPTEGFPTAAKRPGNSRLSCAKLVRDYQVLSRPWEAAIGEIVSELRLAGPEGRK